MPALVLGALTWSEAGPVLVFGGIVAALISVGMFGHRALTKVETLTEREARAIAQNQLDVRNRLLDDLHRKLSADDDPRPESLLSDLRVMMNQFAQEHKIGEKAIGSAPAGVTRQIVEVNSKSERLFISCIQSIERTHQLWQMAQRMSTATARQATLERREKLITEVEASVRHLGKIFDGVHSLGLARDDVDEMARIRSELDQSLETARRVEERMRMLDQELEGQNGQITSRMPESA